ncbi:MAG TPA: branched-chain amino acid ABC transporter permease, partial [Acidimicrobiia bacterium]|nr:branched-chain amino acid ABC transporter permease [Acidimicrobiia bacterium]
MRGRPLLYTSYEADQALLNTTAKRVMLVVFFLVLVSIPFQVIPGLGFLGEDDWLRLLSTTAIFAVGALGLNILTGLAGQVSLGHSFFMGIGAYTSVWLGGAVGGPLIGLGLPIWIWLPAAGIVAALVGVAVGPTAVRVRGLYLAIVTLGLVFIGEYFFRNWNSLTGGAQVGRDFPPLQLRIWKEEPPLIDFTTTSTWLGVEVSGTAKSFFFLVLLAVVFTLLAKILQRTRVGRAFMSIRDRDIAAEIMGVNEFAYKLLAFGISSFFAGIAGALLASYVSRVIPERWDLFLSVQFIAIVLIGGAGTVTGAILGTAFVVLLPRVVQNFTLWMQSVAVEGD